MQAKDIIDQLSPNQLRWALGISITLLLSLVATCTRFLYRKSRDFFAGMNAKLDTIQNNHLHTIQENTGRSAELLEKLVEGQAELNGYIKGKLE
jgi:hypothetical protein